MRTAIAHPTPTAGQSPRLQRKCTCGRPVGPDGECAECKKKRLAGILQRHLGSASPATPAPRQSEASALVHQVLQSPGRPLDPATRAFMEPRFAHDFTPLRTSSGTAASAGSGGLKVGSPHDPREQQAHLMAQRLGDESRPVTLGSSSSPYDFSRVRVHTDAAAAASARAVNAKAYTVGDHVVFGAGQYTPQSAPGRRLLAHELTHVVQQQGGTDQIQRYDESTEPPSRLAEFAKDVLLGPVGRTAINYGCLSDLEAPMGDLTFNRWIPHACGRSASGFLHSREWDAFGHCWIGCEGTRRCGESPTAILGTGREISREMGFGGPHDSFRQDVANQGLGRRLAYTSGTCYNLCDLAHSSGRLDLSAPRSHCANCSTYPASGSEGPCPP